MDLEAGKPDSGYRAPIPMKDHVESASRLGEEQHQDEVAPELHLTEKFTTYVSEFSAAEPMELSFL